MAAGIYTIQVTYDELAALRDSVSARIMELVTRNQHMSELDERNDLGPYRDARTRLEKARRDG